MKKMIIALVAMVMMTMSVNAQSENNNNSMTFDRISSYLDLRIDQVKTVKTAMAQFNSSMEAYHQLKDASKSGETWDKIQARHKANMKKLLDEKQYKKYIEIFDLTVKNTAERIIDKQMASKYLRFRHIHKSELSLPRRDYAEEVLSYQELYVNLQ